MHLTEGMFLCAGLSTRMRPLTNEIPKVLLPLGQKNIFEWTMQYFSSQAIERVSVNLHHGAKHVDAFLQSTDFTQEIHTFEEEKILGTGGGVKNMQAFVTQEHFFVMNCDIMTDLNLQDMYAYHIEKKALATLFNPANPNDKYTKIYADQNNQIHSILQPDTSEKYVGMFGGVTIFSKKIFAHMPLDEDFCLVRSLLEPLCKSGEAIYAYPSDANWFDTGEVALYESAIQTLSDNPLPWMR